MLQHKLISFELSIRPSSKGLRTKHEKASGIRLQLWLWVDVGGCVNWYCKYWTALSPSPSKHMIQSVHHSQGLQIVFSMFTCHQNNLFWKTVLLCSVCSYCHYISNVLTSQQSYLNWAASHCSGYLRNVFVQ